VDGRIVRLDAGPGQLSGVRATVNPALEPPPAGVQFPIGFVQFVVSDLRDGAARVIITLPTPLAINTYYKYGREPNDDLLTPQINESTTDHWYEFLWDGPGTTGAELNRVNPLDQASLVASITLHLEDGQRGDNNGTPGVIGDPGGPGLVNRPLRVQRFVINDGAAQRSKINSLTVTFDGRVTIAQDAFDLRRKGARKPLRLNVALSEVTGRTVATLTFKGRGFVGGSLADGSYRLTIRGDTIRDAATRLLDGDRDGVAGGNQVVEFSRRFGDTDGDGDVDARDKQVFKTTFRKRSRQPSYLWYLDYNADGRVSTDDQAQFQLASRRRGKRR
jgi:hypothetical protein